MPNTAPVAVDDSYDDVSEGQIYRVNSVNGVLTPNDTDGDGDSLSAQLTAAPINPLFQIRTTGAFTYDARYPGQLYVDGDGNLTDDNTETSLPDGFDSLAAGAVVYDSFTYRAWDGQAYDEATVTVTITGENDAPDAVDDLDNETSAGGTVNIDALANDTDPDIYPLADTLTVAALADIADEPGTPGGSDSDLSDGLSITTKEGGTVTVMPDGTIDYEAADGFFGIDTFTYTVGDGKGGTDTATVRVTVTPANTGPTAVDDTRSVDEGDTAAPLASVLGNDTDPDDGGAEPIGAYVTFDASTQDLSDILYASDASGNDISDPTQPLGLLTDFNADGTFSYDPNGAFNSLAEGEVVYVSFNYTAFDGAGEEDTATVTIAINGENDDPTGSDGSATVWERGLTAGTQAEPNTITDTTVLDGYPYGSDIVQTIDLNISDPDGSDSPYLAADSAGSDTDPIVGSYGTLVLNSDGTVTYTLDEAAFHDDDGVTEQDIFDIYVVDGNGGSKALKVTIDVKDDSPYLGDSPIADEDNDNDIEDIEAGTPILFAAGNNQSDTFDFFPGADVAVLDVTSVPAQFLLYDTNPGNPGGEVYVNSSYDGDKTVTGTISGGTLDGEDLYTLVLDPASATNEGKYTFTMLLDAPTDLIPLDFGGGVNPGGPSETKEPLGIIFDGGSVTDLDFDNLGTSFETNEGNGSYFLNPNAAGGIGVGNGNIDQGEALKITTSAAAGEVSGLYLDLTLQAGNVISTEGLLLVWEAWSGGVQVAEGSIDINAESGGTIKDLTQLEILPDVDFDTLYVAMDGLDSNDGVRINNVSVVQQVEVADFSLDFSLAAAENDDTVGDTGDGDVADPQPDADFTVYVDGTDTDSVFTI